MYVNNIPFLSNIPKITVSKLPPDILRLFTKVVRDGYRIKRRYYKPINEPPRNLGMLTSPEGNSLVVIPESGPLMILTHDDDDVVRVNKINSNVVMHWKYEGNDKVYQIILDPIDRIKSLFGRY